MSQELIQTPIPVERKDLSNGRWYTPTDSYWNEHFGEDTPKIYKRSSTTFEDCLDKGVGFHKWLGDAPTYKDAMKYANERATIGTMVHDYCERLLHGITLNFEDQPKWLNQETQELIPVTDEVIKYIMSFEQFCKDSQQNGAFITEATEICMFDLAANNEGKQINNWAGTADWVVKLINKKGEEERWLIDWKTGKCYPKAHQLQLTSYQILWESLFPDKPIHGVACLYLKGAWRTKPNYQLKRYEFIPETWKKVVDISEWVNNYPVPAHPKEYPTTFTLKKEEQELKESA